MVSSLICRKAMQMIPNIQIAQKSRSISMVNLASRDRSPTPDHNAIDAQSPYYKRLKSIGPDDLTPRGPEASSRKFCSLKEVHLVIDHASTSDLQVLEEIHQAIVLKMKEIRDEVEKERRAQLEDWVPDIQAVDDGDKMCEHGKSIGDWTMGRELGIGAFAKVYAVTHRSSGCPGAVKVIAKANLSRDDYIDVRNEHESWLKLPPHPNLPQLTGALQSEHFIYFFQDLASGKDLFDYIKLRQQNGRPVPVEAISQIFLGLTSGLDWCHRHDVCHRDIKPENIIVNQRDYTAKLVDFGCACARTQLQKQCVGSMPFIAPECLLECAQDGASADVWSLGIVVMEMMFGLKALSKALSWDTVVHSTKDCGEQLLKHFEDATKGIEFVRNQLGRAQGPGEKVLASMLQIDPAQRPDMKTLHTVNFACESEALTFAKM
eukprot:gnl/MRDRNA2_/MRDRNA2_102907_c0_seq1.p1 gnl/MRDRNA2_/MRDRNA2_102907_c0~~gnl/MRDRNA2_/MRDRNA2_102907_c0_seq1.p1  ORF type:complete len:433 (-),score=92.77 gnl/MRDRNA2_/MRDRNA2_102907_c0_seq1:101-1399(-)